MGEIVFNVTRIKEKKYMQTVIFVKFTSFMSSRLKLSQNKRCLSSILKPDGKVVV